MIRSLDWQSTSYLEKLRWINSRMERAQREVASGKRVESASDAPDSVSTLLEARANLARIDQVGKNLSETFAP